MAQYITSEKKNKSLSCDNENNLIYSQTIQNGLLPKKRHFDKCFKDSFVYYSPQNTISGDFYWLIKKGNKIYFSLGDCTGHGTSAAMLSVLGISLLNYIVQKDFEYIGDYLRELDKKWIETFKNESNDCLFNNDWIEMVLFCFDTTTNKLSYASAGSEFAMTHNGKIKLYKGNNYPIGGWQIEKDRNFDTHIIDIHENTNIYVFSDGVKHQFDDNNHKKFSRKRLLNFLEKCSIYDMNKQKEMFQYVFDEWKGPTTQTDDVSLIGMQLL
jgi:serine phosphatase RsbU (regulator of sigma subunit)